MSTTTPVAVTPQLLDTIFSSAPDHVYLFDKKKRYRFVNERAPIALGVPRERLLGKTWQEAGLDPQAMSAFEPDLDHVLTTGEPKSGRVEYPTAFGRRFYEYSVQLAQDEDGEDAALVTVYDRTPGDALDAERNLAELESIYAHAPVGLAVLDDQLRFVRVNERLAQMNGFTPEEHLGRLAWDLVPDIREAAEPQFLKVLETGEGIFDVEIVGETPAEPGVKRIWIEHYVPLKNNSGEVIGINAVVQEVTEQRRAERELRQAKRQLEVTLTATEVGLWRWDLENDVFVGDENLQRLFGVEELRAASDLGAMIERVHAEDRERVRAAIREALERGDEYDESYRVVWGDGTVRWIHARGRVQRDEHGKPVEFPGVVVDITSLKRAEEALRELNQELEKRVLERTAELQEVTDDLQMFLYTASHDLRAPLRGIDGFSKVLLDDYGNEMDEAGRSHLERIRSGAERIGLLIDGLLELSRLSQAPLVPQEFDLSALANEVLEELAAREPEREVKGTVQPGLRVRGDIGMVRLLLEELLKNSLAFTRDRSECTVEFLAVSNDEEVAFCVRDNGVGFDARFADRMFMPFRVIHSPRQHQGTGMGLALARRIVHNHGGRIWAESKVGQGASFYFTLPG